MATLPTVGGDVGTWGTELNTWLLVDHNADGTNIGGGGGASFPRGILPYPPITAWFAGNSLQTANDVVYVAFYVDHVTTITDVIIHHQSAGGNVKVGIYSDDAGPDVLLGSSGSIAASTVHALTTPVELDPGRYFAAMMGNDSGRRVYWSTMLVGSTSTEDQWYAETAASYNLPNPAAATIAVNSVVYNVFAGSFP